MGDSTGISWTDATWNPVRGCSRVSEGCRHCYAEVQAARIVRMGKGKPTAYDGLVRTVDGEPRWTGEVRLVPGQLAWPLRKRKPLRIFVNSMSDLFHEKLTNEQIAAVFGVMAACPQHTFQCLTKRAKRMREWFEWVDEQAKERWGSGSWSRPTLCAIETHEILRERDIPSTIGRSWPLPNVHLGVSVENQDVALERITHLINTPAALRFLSLEPLLGYVDLGPSALAKLGWVIAGCESGPGSRPCDVAWLRMARDRCAAAGVPFFLKQAVEQYRPVATETREPTPLEPGLGSKRKTGGVIELPYLDGVQHAAFPEVR